MFIVSYLLRELFRPLEDIISFTFVPRITGGHMYSDHDWKLLSLPARFGGFGTQIKTKRERREKYLKWTAKPNEW